MTADPAFYTYTVIAYRPSGDSSDSTDDSTMEVFHGQERAELAGRVADYIFSGGVDGLDDPVLTVLRNGLPQEAGGGVRELVVDEISLGVKQRRAAARVAEEHRRQQQAAAEERAVAVVYARLYARFGGKDPGPPPPGPPTREEMRVLERERAEASRVAAANAAVDSVRGRLGLPPRQV